MTWKLYFAIAYLIIPPISDHVVQKTILLLYFFQYDQMTVQRNTLRTQLEQEIAKRSLLEEKIRANDDQWKIRVSQAVSFRWDRHKLIWCM